MVLGLPTKEAELNLETEIVPVLLTIQVPTEALYITVSVPTPGVTTSAGLKSPFGLTAGFALHVPPPGVAVSITVPDVLHNGPGRFNAGVTGLLTVSCMVWVTGQLVMVGDTTTV